MAIIDYKIRIYQTKESVEGLEQKEYENYDLSTTFDDVGVIEECNDIEYQKLCRKTIKNKNMEMICWSKQNKKGKSIRKTAPSAEKLK